MSRDPQDFVDCIECNGTGQIYYDDEEEYDDCPLCDGSGDMHPDDDEREDDPDRDHDSRNDFD